ncbi:MAG: hypothetical protein CFH15_01077 [Alphaproteobacteria bacterium MarineAlpha5_Bin5]|nr:MAG: hypothetical protein CFH15_01077 [Alphaproteobacteria bacterium MarineAlpha5_Bin5]PPR50320.1 MAG: hypothetical protein CFH14_00911 [Alphaproteobacteria bacterium MarineAlpha5_Bin4]|tara:strand:+ start:816 stop:2633 length:1818 start_codon:yes stop_codon:yes gene_type:complete
MLFFAIYFTSVIIVTLGYGLLLKNFLIKEKLISSIGIGSTGLLGFYFILIISFLLHFFLPLNYFVTVLIYLIGIILFFYFKNILKVYFAKKYIILIIILILPGLFSIKGHPDLEWYHLPYLNYLKDFKIIFGIANVNDFLAFQSWNDIAGALRAPIIDAKGINIIPAIFAIYFIFSLLEILSKSNNTSLKIFIFLILIFSISKYHKIYEYGGHVPPLLLGFLINIYFFSLIFDTKNKSKDIISKILIFSSFVLLLRINYIFIFPVFIYIFLRHKNILLNFILNKKILILIITIPFLHFTKNFIHTGCLMYPIDNTCFSNEEVIWSVGKDYAKLRYDGVQAGARGWSEHVLLDGKINDRVDYLIPLKENLIFSHSEYMNQGKFFWIKYWIRSGDSIKILNNFVIIFFCFIIIFVVGKFKKTLIDKKFNFYNYLNSFFVFFGQLILWFILTPQTIYGGDVATIIFSAFIASFFLKNLVIENYKTKIALFSLFLLSLLYFEIKNIQRTYIDYFKNTEKLNYFPWIAIKNNKYGIDYYSIIIDNKKLYVQKKIKGRKIGLADPCGNTPMICIPEERVQCVKNIEEKFTYLVIKGNEKLCIKHLEKRAFY